MPLALIPLALIPVKQLLTPISDDTVFFLANKNDDPEIDLTIGFIPKPQGLTHQLRLKKGWLIEKQEKNKWIKIANNRIQVHQIDYGCFAGVPLYLLVKFVN
jgi:hypothetical protein